MAQKHISLFALTLFSCIIGRAITNEYDFHNINYSGQICQIIVVRAGATRSYMLFIAVPYFAAAKKTKT